jgi:hypothetical protein
MSLGVLLIGIVVTIIVVAGLLLLVSRADRE